MSSGIDRRIGSNSSLAVVALLVVLAASAGGYLWYRSTTSVAPSGPAAYIPVRFDEPLAVTLVVPGGAALSPQSTTVRRQPDTQSPAREVLTALLADPRSLRSPVLAGVKLRAFFLDSAGTAFVDVVSQSSSGVKASAWEELLGIYSFVNTLTQNFEEIRQVRFLLEGREAQTLAGHIDLSRTYTRRDDLGK